jgi:hypothetical protein
MIFARRAIQTRIDEMRKTFEVSSVDDIVLRLNRPGKDRLAAMWEVAVLSSLAKISSIDHELPLESGRKPDVKFISPELTFTADVTCVSDRGLDDENPFDELMRLLSKAQAKLGLPSGGLDLRALSKDVTSRRGQRRVLRLPPKNKLHDFVRNDVLPQLRAQIAEGAPRLRVIIDREDVGVEITIDPNGSEFTTGGYAPYSSPTIKDQNPLFNALKQKASQIRAAEGLKGIIVGDGDCAALSTDRVGPDAFSPKQIAAEFLRQYSSVGFVLMIGVRDVFGSTMPVHYVNSLYPILITRENDETRMRLATVFEQMLKHFPKPVNSAVNGALRASETGYELGNHGAYEMCGSKIRVSAREMMEVLAGLRTFDDLGSLKSDKQGRNTTGKSEITKAFEHEIALGRLPARMSIIETSDDDNDQWIEFEFDRRDVAISPFQ